jgi:ABC-type phosphate transport system ATPase subunit
LIMNSEINRIISDYTDPIRLPGVKLTDSQITDRWVDMSGSRMKIALFQHGPLFDQSIEN